MKFQNGGFIPQVYNTQQVNPVFLDGNMKQLIQTASMPMESGLQGYMGLQQLDIQRDQEKRAKEEFKYKIKAYDRAELDATLKQMNTLRDDFINLDLLPADAQRYSEITSQYVPEDIKRRAISGDINAMKELYMGYNSVMMHPEVKQMLIRKKTNDKNTEIFTKNKDLLDYMTNSNEIMQAITSGTPMPSIQLDSERYKRDQEIARTYKQNLDKARALELNARTNALQQDIEDKNIARESLRSIAANELGIGNIPYDQQSPENKAKISAKSWELENADLIAKYKSAPTALAKQQLALQIEQSKMNRVNELISDGVTPEKAFNVVYGEQEKTKSESDYEYFSRQMRSDHPGIAEEEIRVKYNEKTSNVNYNYENVGSGGRKREDGNIERQDYTIVNKDGETIGFKLNGQDKFTDDFPSSKFSFKGGILSIEGDLNNTELSYLKQLFLNETFKTLEDLKDIPGAVWENPFFSNSILRLNVAEYNKSKILTQSNSIPTPQYNNPIIDLSKGTYKTSVGERKIIPYNTQTGNTNYVKKDNGLTLDTNVYYIKDSGADSFNANDISDTLLITLNMIAERNPSGRALITSGKRSEEYNKKVGGKSNSHHLTGDAVDIAADPGVVEYLTKGEGASILKSQGFTAINEGDHIHIQSLEFETSGKNW